MKNTWHKWAKSPPIRNRAVLPVCFFVNQEKHVFITFLHCVGVVLEGGARLCLNSVRLFEWITPLSCLHSAWLRTVPRKGHIPAPHTFRASFGRTVKSRVWPVRHWGGEHPLLFTYYVNRSMHKRTRTFYVCSFFSIPFIIFALLIFSPSYP